MPELDYELFRQCNPLTDEERKKLEEEFDREEEEIRDKLASRTDEEKQRVADFVFSLFGDIIDKYGFARKT